MSFILFCINLKQLAATCRSDQTLGDATASLCRSTAPPLTLQITSVSPPHITHKSQRKERASGYLSVWSREPLAWLHQLRFLCWLLSWDCIFCGEGLFFLYSGMSHKRRRGGSREGGGVGGFRPLGYSHEPLVPVYCWSEKHSVLQAGSESLISSRT